MIYKIDFLQLPDNIQSKGKPYFLRPSQNYPTKAQILNRSLRNTCLLRHPMFPHGVDFLSLKWIIIKACLTVTSMHLTVFCWRLLVSVSQSGWLDDYMLPSAVASLDKFMFNPANSYHRFAHCNNSPFTCCSPSQVTTHTSWC